MVSSSNWKQIHLDQLQNPSPPAPIIPLDFISGPFNKALQWHHRIEFESHLHNKCSDATICFLFSDPWRGRQTLPGISTRNLSSSPAGKTGTYVEVPDHWHDHQTKQVIFIPSVSIWLIVNSHSKRDCQIWFKTG